MKTLYDSFWPRARMTPLSFRGLQSKHHMLALIRTFSGSLQTVLVLMVTANANTFGHESLEAAESLCDHDWIPSLACMLSGIALYTSCD